MAAPRLDSTFVRRIIAAYRKSGNLSAVARQFNRRHSSTWQLLSRRGLIRPRLKNARRWFKGHCYVRVKKTGLFYCEAAPERYLHRAVWVHHCGPVTRDFVILFRNGDRNDCAIENLRCSRRRGEAASNPWVKWKRGAGPRPVDHTLRARNAGSRTFWRRMNPGEREIYVILRGLVAAEGRKAGQAAKQSSRRFFQMLAAGGALATK